MAEKILIVDDEPFNVDLLEQHLEEGSSEESVGERAGFLGRILGRLKIA